MMSNYECTCGGFKLRGALKLCIDILEVAYHADYSNGNEANGFDEGRVMAGRCLDQFRERLRTLGGDALDNSRLPILNLNVNPQELKEARDRMESQADTLREIMSKYDESRKQWIAKYGSDERFNNWFTLQIRGDED